MRRILKSIFWVATVLSLMMVSLSAQAHEVRPAIADIKVTADRVEISLRLAVEPWLAGIDVSQITDTDEALEADTNDQLRALSTEALSDRIQGAWERIREDLKLRADDIEIPLDLVEIHIADEPDLSLSRETTLFLAANLPANGVPVTFGWIAPRGPLILRQSGGAEIKDSYTGYLTRGAESDPIPRKGLAMETTAQVFNKYIVSGFEHIIPKGLDHILFVLGLFFLSTRWRPLIFQVTAFTLAHTVTLAMASLGIITIAPEIVEPLIAATIVYVGVENILRPKMTGGRLALIFAFGLLHGLGFAAVLGDVGLSAGPFVVGLIGFNIGVELGQLTVIAIAWVLFSLPFRNSAHTQKRLATTASFLIAAIGLYWVIERTIF